MKTIVNDREGHVKEYFFDRGNRVVTRREYTGLASRDRPTTETSNRPSGRLRSSDPAFFETLYDWTEDSLMRQVVHPNGNITEYVYEADLNPNAPPRIRGNRRIVRHLPGTHSPSGDQTMIEEQFEYDTSFGCAGCGFNFVTRFVDGRGNEVIHSYDDRGNRIHTEERVATTVWDYEYNSFGQRTATVHPDNGSDHRRRDEHTYYTSGSQHGYRRQTVVDVGGFSLTSTFEYNAVGILARQVDPRGHDIQYVVNSLDQVVRVLSREVSDGSELRYEKDYTPTFQKIKSFARELTRICANELRSGLGLAVIRGN